MRPYRAWWCVAALILVGSVAMGCSQPGYTQMPDDPSPRYANRSSGGSAYQPSPATRTYERRYSPADLNPAPAVRSSPAPVAPAPPARNAFITPAASPQPAARPVPIQPASEVSYAAAPLGAAPSGVSVRKAFPREIIANRPFIYEIHLTNNSSNKYEGVVLTEQPPAAVELIETNPGARSGGDGQLQWAVGTLLAGENRIFRVTARATRIGAIESCSTVTYSSVWCDSATVVSPALKLAKTAPPQVTLCDPITFTYRVTNPGTGTARGVRISENLPQGLTTLDGQSSVYYEVGDLAGGQSRDYQLQVKATRPGRYASQAVAQAQDSLASEAASATEVTEPVLQIAQSSPQRAYLGKPVVFNVEVRNTGDAPAERTTVESLIPSGAEIASASDNAQVIGNRMVWTLGTLNAGSSKKLSYTLRPDGKGQITTNTVAKATCAKDVATSSLTEVVGIPAILLEVVDDDPIQVGQTTVYTIEVTNQGSATGRNVRIVARMEDSMQFVSAVGATPGVHDGSATAGVLTFQPLVELPSKAKATWKVTVRAVKPGDVRFHVEMNEDQLGRPVTETEATNFYE